MDVRFSRGVRRVVVVKQDESGKRTATTLYSKEQPPQEGTAGIGTLEKVVKAANDGLRSFGDDYLERHKASNQRNPDGWLRDLPMNLYHASQQAAKKFQAFPFPVPYVDFEEQVDD